jgi:hypothetical protein
MNDDQNQHENKKGTGMGSYFIFVILFITAFFALAKLVIWLIK